MFYFHFAQIVQPRLPLPIVHEIVRHSLRKKNVSGVSAIHDALRDVYSSAGNVGLLIQVSDFIYRAAVNSHSQPQLRLFF